MGKAAEEYARNGFAAWEELDKRMRRLEDQCRTGTPAPEALYIADALHDGCRSLIQPKADAATFAAAYNLGIAGRPEETGDRQRDAEVVPLRTVRAVSA